MKPFSHWAARTTTHCQALATAPMPPTPDRPQPGSGSVSLHAWAARLLAMITLTLLLPGRAMQGAESRPSGWEDSIVEMDVTRKQYDYTQPWTRRMQSRRKAGLVLEGHEILTTADQVYDRTLVRIQKRGRGKWYIGDVTWIDYHANLAIVTTEEPGFWDDLKPIVVPEGRSPSESMQIVRWREGKLEMRKAEFSQYTVDTGDLSFVPRILLEISAEIQGVGWGEPVFSNDTLIGLSVQHTGNKISVLPASFIRPILSARKLGTYRGLGFFDFFWQAAVNPASLEHLKLKGEPRGAIVIEVPSHPGQTPVLQPLDILLKIDGFDIDMQGDYQDPDYGPLLLENLATRGKWAGDAVPMTISREGRELEILYRLPKAEFSTSLVPDATYDQAPEYLIAGGFVFQPLNDPYLKAWGPDWKRRSPFRIYYFNNQAPTPEQPALVLLSQVLPDVYNLGYQDVKYLVVKQVNGRRIARLEDLHAALENPPDGFHIIEFMESDSLRRLVVSAADLEAATQRVLQRYGIASDHHLSSESPAETVTAGKP
jgi:hypothetical protein